MLNELHNLTPGGVAFVAEDGRIVTVSQGFADLFGTEESKLANLHFCELGAVLPICRAPPIGKMDTINDDGEEFICISDNPKKWLHLRYNDVKQEEVSAANEQIRWLVHASEAASVMKQRGFFKSMIRKYCHDMRNHLFVISGYMEMISTTHGKATEMETRYWDKMATGVRTASVLNDDLSQIYHATDEKGTVVKMDVGPVIRRIAEHLSSAEEFSLELELEEPLIASVIERSIESVTERILLNCSRFRHPDRPLNVSIVGKNAHCSVSITIRDNGVGVPDPQLDRVMMPFQYYVDPLVSVGRTSGNGVAHSVLLLQQFNARLRFKTEYQKYFEVTVTLPRYYLNTQ